MSTQSAHKALRRRNEDFVCAWTTKRVMVELISPAAAAAAMHAMHGQTSLAEGFGAWRPIG